MTRILTRGDLLTLLDPSACLDALRDGFARDAGGAAVEGQRIRTDLPFPGTATALLPGLLPGVEAYTVKVNAKFPAATPALRGVICLHDGADGELLALLDSATITAWRTGLAAALGTHVLASPGSDVVGVVGAGAQADLVVTGLRRLRPLRDLVVHDLSPERAAAFAARHGGGVAGSAAEVAARAGIVVLATWSRAPLLDLPDVRPGAHLTTLGVDEPGKQELSPALLRAAGVLAVDDRPLAAAMGVLAATGLPAGAAHATLGELLRGDHPGRTGPDQITVYGPVGLPWQDLALSLLAWREAGRRGVGAEIDLLA
ncbi:L-lysine cyclodeaminase [Nonomuraea coxensis DSM 45129]|uniref:L-lysine cyclodeaminase n=1 Tax=Nonomuraea coxensis DSM 45129 TaxID=1122611 RepID=A0ABX8U976_9ACTN|nr:ornithine cyclodeaminase family protein [Nonomuraea coxensis]QYC43288.1 L-lysine cyclodeaminase [Nonomuraea coxensis DSM 45129]